MFVGFGNRFGGMRRRRGCGCLGLAVVVILVLLVLPRLPLKNQMHVKLRESTGLSYFRTPPPEFSFFSRGVVYETREIFTT
jgi:hypothetical protein